MIIYLIIIIISLSRPSVSQNYQKRVKCYYFSTEASLPLYYQWAPYFPELPTVTLQKKKKSKHFISEMTTVYENLPLSTLFMSVLCLVAQSCPAPCGPMDCSLPGSSVEFSREEYWSGYHALLQGIFLTQGSNLSLPHCRWIFYHLSHQGRLFRIFVSGILDIQVQNILNTLLFGRLYCCSQFLTFYLCPNFFCR